MLLTLAMVSIPVTASMLLMTGKTLRLLPKNLTEKSECSRWYVYSVWLMIHFIILYNTHRCFFHDWGHTMHLCCTADTISSSFVPHVDVWSKKKLFLWTWMNFSILWKKLSSGSAFSGNSSGLISKNATPVHEI